MADKGQVERRITPGQAKELPPYIYPMAVGSENAQRAKFAFEAIYSKKYGQEYIFDPKEIRVQNLQDRPGFSSVRMPILYEDFVRITPKDIDYFKSLGGEVAKDKDGAAIIVLPDYVLEKQLDESIRRVNKTIPSQIHYFKPEEANQLINGLKKEMRNGSLEVTAQGEYTLQGGEHNGKQEKSTISPERVDLRIHHDVIPSLTHPGIASGNTYDASNPEMKKIVAAAATVVVRPTLERRVTPEAQLAKENTPEEIVKAAKTKLGISPVDGKIDQQFTDALKGGLEKVQAKTVLDNMKHIAGGDFASWHNRYVRNENKFTDTFYRTSLSPDDQVRLREAVVSALKTDPLVQKYLEIAEQPATPKKRVELDVNIGDAVKRLADSARPTDTAVRGGVETADAQNTAPASNGAGRGLA